MKKIVSMLLSVVMLCSVTTGLDLTAYAADTTITGKCGENATYAFDKNTKTLTISGAGMIDSTDSDFPSSDSIVSLVIKDGITEIGYEMFFGCENLENIVIPDSVVSISRDAFKGTKYYNVDSRKSGAEWTTSKCPHREPPLPDADYKSRPSSFVALAR